MKKQLKIALFTYSTKPRGGVIHTIELGEALQREGHRICIYALDKDNIGFHRSLNCPSRLIPTKPAINRELLLTRKQNHTDKEVEQNNSSDQINQLIKQRIQEFIDYLSKDTETYDIYHSQDCISANALKRLRDQKQIPHFIRTVHHIDQFNSRYLQECHDRSILEPDRCLCVSQYWQKQLAQQYKIEASIVFNGVDIQRFNPQIQDKQITLKQKLGINNQTSSNRGQSLRKNAKNNPVYLTIGGIEPRKNSLELLKAFDQVLKKYPQAQLIIAGGETLFDYEPYRLQFFDLAKQTQINIGKSLILPGVILDENLPALYHCADAFVFPSIKEGWGLVLLEAIASGLPVITSNISPFTEFLTSDSALLVNPNSYDEIAKGMEAVLNEKITKKLIQNSATIPKQYSWQRSAKLHLKQYFKIIDN